MLVTVLVTAWALGELVSFLVYRTHPGERVNVSSVFAQLVLVFCPCHFAVVISCRRNAEIFHLLSLRLPCHPQTTFLSRTGNLQFYPLLPILLI